MDQEPLECRVCQRLQLDSKPPAIDLPRLEHHFGQYEPEFELDSAPKKCCLWRLIRDLYLSWSGKNTPKESEYIFTCAPQSLRIFGIEGSSGEVVDPDPLSPATLARIRRWIDICDSSHERCQRDRNPLLPTRILDVGIGTSASQVAKLIVTDGQRGQYIALSHCWGTANQFMTTQATLPDMKAGFLPELATATFRDAIIIARHLGIRYLWIDSLCIIQGDTSDWQIQSSQMGQVYRNAYLTISASSASDDVEGFLTPRSPVYSTLEVVSPSGNRTQIHLRPPGLTATPITVPLDSRGWTLQEAYLSCRQLKFHKNKILWDCQTCCYDEAYTDQYNLKYQVIVNQSIDLLFPDRIGRTYSYHKWYDMIEDYSRRQLRFDSDKLPGVSGLASILANEDGARYCAGIWWEDIWYGISWEVDKAASRKPDCFIAPSWSWASVVGPVTFSDRRWNISYVPPQPLDLVTFHDCIIEHQGRNEHGEIKNGWIRLDAPIIPLQSTSGTSTTSGTSFEIPGTEKGEDRLRIRFDTQEENKDPLWVLFLTHAPGTWKTKQYFGNKAELSGLVIRPVCDISSDRCKKIILQTGDHQLYERVGFFDMTITETEGDFLSEGSVAEIVLI
ncbi:uncharacterized protein BP5553_06371 [Venustampulla echinocandica]|uniref:Heterokaryon incompatibility domain-containing protein n=1 Tax=Venustampulla echinocandica TaxID=2656787 RepID=A0A370TJS5_9HELO|nr:uncharacterized protein BP5553_06371 [Venustampulla echinocandica]RDL35759.1 hypothetical protein BP5553_06371 [Venustampulla echinocandica]